jgi:hypothetical protein
LAGQVEDYCWCCGQGKEKEVELEPVEKDLGPDLGVSGYLWNGVDSPDFLLEAKAWRGSWTGADNPVSVKVTEVRGWSLYNWNEDQDGGPGVVFMVHLETVGGKPYSVQVILPKDELIRALASTVNMDNDL